MNTTMEPTTNTRFKSYTLHILPEGSRLTLDQEQGILTMTRSDQFIEQQLLSPSETYVIIALLDNYPDYCPYEYVLHAMTGKKIEWCQEKVLWGLENGAVDVVMRPVRNLLGRVRLKLRPFGIDVKSLVHMGYTLIARRKKVRP